MNHQRRNSRKQHERKFDRKGVAQLSKAVSGDLLGLAAELQAFKAIIEAMIRVLDIDAAVVAQLKRDAKAQGEEEGNDLPPVSGEIGTKRPSWWRRLFRRKQAAPVDPPAPKLADLSDEELHYHGLERLLEVPPN